jgi:hypothetical protein
VLKNVQMYIHTFYYHLPLLSMFTIQPLKLDLPHTQSGETPLHFACKYGREEIVAFLVGFSCTCQTIKNKYGQVPADMVCTKDGNKSAKSRIEQLLKGTCVCVRCVVPGHMVPTSVCVWCVCVCAHVCISSDLIKDA